MLLLPHSGFVRHVYVVRALVPCLSAVLSSHRQQSSHVYVVALQVYLFSIVWHSTSHNYSWNAEVIATSASSSRSTKTIIGFKLAHFAKEWVTIMRSIPSAINTESSTNNPLITVQRGIFLCLLSCRQTICWFQKGSPFKNLILNFETWERLALLLLKSIKSL